MMEAAVFLARWLRERLGCPRCAYEAERLCWADFDPDEWS